MKINDFIQNFANQFDETDASEFQATTELGSLMSGHPFHLLQLYQ